MMGFAESAPETTSTNLQGIIDKVRASNPETKILIAGMEMPGSMGQDYTTPISKGFFRFGGEEQGGIVAVPARRGRWKAGVKSVRPNSSDCAGTQNRGGKCLEGTETAADE